MRKTKNFQKIYQILPECLFKLQAFWLLFSFVFLTFYPSVQIFANPLIPDALTPDPFQEDRLDEIIRQANTARDLDTWNAQVYGEKAAMMTEWEIRLDEQITQQIENDFHKDAYVDNPGYKDYLRKQLEIAKQKEVENWESEASIQILTNRNKYMNYMTGKLLSEEKEDTKKAQQQTEEYTNSHTSTNESWDAAQKSFTEKQEKWQKDYQGSVEQGLREFSSAVKQINHNYLETIQSLKDNEEKFDSALQTIQGYEKTVRSAISGLSTKLRGQLDDPNYAQMYKTDSNIYNEAGQALANLLNTLDAKLQDPDSSLSDISVEIVTYLQDQTTATYQKQQYHGARIKRTFVNTTDGVGNTDIRSSDGAASLHTFWNPGHGKIKSITDYLQNKTAQSARDLFNYYNQNEYHFSPNITLDPDIDNPGANIDDFLQANLFAHTGTPNTGINTISVGGLGGNYLDDPNFHQYDRRDLVCLGPGLCGYIDYKMPEEEIQAKLVFKIHDT
ncbi:MAG: TIGR04388 family protein, partial [Spirochaetota bacterium]